MFVEFKDGWPPPEPWRPERPPTGITPKGERVLGWVLALNLLALICAPFAGATVIDAVVAILRH